MCTTVQPRLNSFSWLKVLFEQTKNFIFKLCPLMRSSKLQKLLKISSFKPYILYKLLLYLKVWNTVNYHLNVIRATKGAQHTLKSSSRSFKIYGLELFILSAFAAFNLNSKIYGQFLNKIFLISLSKIFDHEKQWVSFMIRSRFDDESRSNHILVWQLRDVLLDFKMFGPSSVFFNIKYYLT